MKKSIGMTLLALTLVGCIEQALNVQYASDSEVCFHATLNNPSQPRRWSTLGMQQWVAEAKSRGLTCRVPLNIFSELSDKQLCSISTWSMAGNKDDYDGMRLWEGFQ